MSTIEELNKEYEQICVTIGDAQIKIDRLNGFIHEQKLKIVELDKKASWLNKPEETKEVVADKAP